MVCSLLADQTVRGEEHKVPGDTLGGTEANWSPFVRNRERNRIRIMHSHGRCPAVQLETEASELLDGELLEVQDRSVRLFVASVSASVSSA